jgi:hypothetical protein
MVIVKPIQMRILSQKKLHKYFIQRHTTERDVVIFQVSSWSCEASCGILRCSHVLL